MKKIYTVDNGYIRRVRVDETTRTVYLAKLGDETVNVPGYKEHKHVMSKYYRKHDDVVPWKEVALPYKNIFFGEDACEKREKQKLREQYKRMNPYDSDEEDTDDAKAYASYMAHVKTAKKAYESISKQAFKTYKHDAMEAYNAYKLTAKNPRKDPYFYHRTEDDSESESEDDYEEEEDDSVEVVAVLLEIDLERISEKSSKHNVYAFIGGDITFFSTKKKIVRFVCELGNSASLDAIAHTEDQQLDFKPFLCINNHACIGYERDFRKPLNQVEMHSMLQTLATNSDSDF